MPQQDPPELTLKAILLGLFLAFIFGSANAYLGMRAGQTVAATIPAAVIALALFRLPWMRGTLAEQNIARTAASVGEALVSGAIFVIPAFLLADLDGQRPWRDLRSHYGEATIILLVGGLIGVLYTILLRRPLFGERGLPWPESVASVEIIRAGQGSADAPRFVFGALAWGALLQFLKSDKGMQVFREYTEGFLAFPASVVRHFNFSKQPIGAVTHGGGIAWSTPALSPALIGIGYIIGPELACISVAGGVLAWWLLIPLLLFFDPDLPRRLGGAETATPDVLAYTVWYNVVRPIAVGAMLVAAGRTMFGLRGSIVQSVRGAFVTAGAAAGSTTERTERDIPLRWVMLGLAALLVPLTATYFYYTQGLGSALVAALLMSVLSFLLTAVGGYLVGLVGVSNQPLSGLTLSALIITALVMLGLGVTGLSGITAVLGVAAVVSCVCSVSGSLIQDLKAGQLLGGTPWKMQAVEILAVVLLSVSLMAPIIALHEANAATGGIGGRALPAPQAGLMAQLARGIVGGEMAWGLLGIGIAFGLALLLCGAKAPMLIAVGMYLPFDTTSAIFVGGVIKWLLDRAVSRRAEADRLRAEEVGTLLASGLIAGEAIMGILLAVTFLLGVQSFTQLVTGAEALPFFGPLGGPLSALGFASLAYMLIAIPLRRRSSE